MRRLRRGGGLRGHVALPCLLLVFPRELTQAPHLEAPVLDRIVRAQVDSGFSGVVLVAIGDSIVLRRAYSRTDPRVNTGSGFWIASMTKGFTAAAVMSLVEQHRLSLADSLARFVPDAPRDKRGITIRQLLTHTAGLGGDQSGSGIANRAAAVRAILAPPLLHTPGSGYRYGDDDYELLAAIVEQVTGARWEQYVQRALLDPLGLRHTGFWCQRGSGVPVPVTGSDGSRLRCTDPAGSDWGHRGANGMSSTVDDLFRWARALQSAGPLPAETRRALSSPQVVVRREDSTDVSYSYGARVYSRGDKVIEIMHSGSGDHGHTGIVRGFPSGVTVIVLSNAGHHHGTTWSSWVAQLLLPRDSMVVDQAVYRNRAGRAR